MKRLIALLALTCSLVFSGGASAHYVGLGFNSNLCPPIDYQLNGDGPADDGGHDYFGSNHVDYIIGSAGSNCDGKGFPDQTHPWYDDEILGWRGEDTLDGKEGHDYVHGGIADDIVIGGYGNDQIFGGNGDDKLKCGPGTNDSAWGGGGVDIFEACENVYA